jgi:hypothetical protein
MKPLSSISDYWCLRRPDRFGLELLRLEVFEAWSTLAE